MLDRAEIVDLLGEYPNPPIVAAVGSHSALDIADGAVTEGFRTLVLGQSGREATYAQYYRTRRDASGRVVRGCVDDVWAYPRFADLAKFATQERLRSVGALVVPNRALSSYVALDVIESEFRVPIVGSRSMLRIEERTERENYYTLLEAAGIPTPTRIATPKE